MGTTNGLLETLGIDVPIIQAPMAGVSTPAMAAAVSAAGALGSIGVGAMDATAARRAIHGVRELTARPFNVNVFCHQPAVADAAREAEWIARLAPEFARLGAAPPHALREVLTSFLVDDAMLAMLLEERPPVVSFHFGLPSAERIAALRAAGIVLLAAVTNPAEARVVAAAGIDAVVAQGFEAGGHRGVFDPAARDGRLGALVLTRLLARELPLPVITAGGIMDGAGIAACLAAGASAAQLGTAFIGCPESAADDAFRAALTSPSAEHTFLTRTISGRVARCIPNHLTDLVAGASDADVPDYPIAYDATKALVTAAKAAGETRVAAHLAGQGAPLARVLPAAALVAMLCAELDEACTQRG